MDANTIMLLLTFIFSAITIAWGIHIVNSKR